MGHDGQFQEIIKKHRNQIDNNKGWNNHTQCCHQCTTKTSFLISGKGCAVDSDGTWGGFRNNSHIHHLIVSNPLFSFYTVVFNCGNHGVTSTKGKQPDLCKSQEQIKQDIHTSSSLRYSH